MRRGSEYICTVIPLIAAMTITFSCFFASTTANTNGKPDVENNVIAEQPSTTAFTENKIISINGRTVVWYNNETGREEIVKFGDMVPLEDVKELAQTYLIEGTSLIETQPAEQMPSTKPIKEKETRSTPMPSPVATPTPKPGILETIIGNQWYYIVSIGIGIIAVVAGIRGLTKKGKKY